MRERPAAWSEHPERWSRPWVVCWMLSGLSTCALAFVLPFRAWSLVACVLFGIPELWALRRKGDRYPPLTYVTAYYLPRWLTMSLVGFLTGSIAATWFGFPRPFSLGAVMALHAWALSHFDVTYDERGPS